MQNPKHEQIEFPHLDPKIKQLNGKSTRKLQECIDILTDLLEHHKNKESKPKEDDQ